MKKKVSAIRILVSAQESSRFFNCSIPGEKVSHSGGPQRPAVMLRLLLIVFAMLGTDSFSQIYLGENTSISFFSATAMENIDAVNTVTKPVFNAGSGELLFKATNSAFKFKSQLMEEHFNENYMESEKYPHTLFKGKITDKIDYSRDGVYEVSATGVLSMHGVDKERTIKGRVTIKDGKLKLFSKFMVKLSDHNIKVPGVVTYNIAEEVEVTVDALMALYKK
ncbi:MAG: YceI family protein [Bacteroidia bacterium]